MCILYRYPQRFMITFFFENLFFNCLKVQGCQGSWMPDLKITKLTWLVLILCHYDLTWNLTWLQLKIHDFTYDSWDMPTFVSMSILKTHLVSLWLDLSWNFTWLYLKIHDLTYDSWDMPCNFCFLFSKLKYMTWYGYMNMESLTTNSHFTSIPPHNDYE